MKIIFVKVQNFNLNIYLVSEFYKLYLENHSAHLHILKKRGRKIDNNNKKIL